MQTTSSKHPEEEKMHPLFDGDALLRQLTQIGA